MRFDHVLSAYWPKGFFFGGQLFYFDKTIDEVLARAPGLGRYTRSKLVDRYELDYFLQCEPGLNLLNFQEQGSEPKEFLQSLNKMMSEISSVNELRHMKHERALRKLYLLRTYRGRCHAQGKPTRGQRTWSNGWTPYKYNTYVRTWLNESERKGLMQPFEKKKPKSKHHHAIVVEHRTPRKWAGAYARKIKHKSTWF
jgi:ribosomal protein S13